MRDEFLCMALLTLSLQRPLCHDYRYVYVAAAVCDYGLSPPKFQELVKVSPGKVLRASLVSHKVASNIKERRTRSKH